MSSSATYEDYEREYQACLSRIRSILASSANRTNRITLEDCERLLNDAKQYAIGMQGMAEIENNSLRIETATNLLIRDVNPLQKEIKRTLEQLNQRTELFQGNAQQQQNQNQQSQYNAPNINNPYYNSNNNNDTMMDSLILSSDDLLRDSQALLAETEQISTSTLIQMGYQREQIQNSMSNVQRVQSAAYHAGLILKSMSIKAWKNNVSLKIMITILSLLNIFVLYRIYKKHHKNNTSNYTPPGY